MFRFHTGSIKRRIQDARNSLQSLSFDSILVRLKSALPEVDLAVAGRFDSILVRLKDRIHASRKQKKNAFRFHAGSIKRVSICSSLFLRGGFRFHTGSIKSVQFREKPAPCLSVSIPYWFD